MNLLLTSDWQAEVGNLDLCEIALTELLAAAKKYQPIAIIHAGDLKESYNPVDIRVVKFWMRAIRQIKDAGFRFIVNMGNHDRISQSRESKNWFDILRAAGAETVTKPAVKRWAWNDDHIAIAFLPYTADKALEVEWANQLDVDTASNGAYKILIFHTEVNGAVMNSAGVKAKGNTARDLKFDVYDACFGGHLHMHQKIRKNAWYIGSPFCMDWSEANGRKGHLLVEL